MALIAETFRLIIQTWELKDVDALVALTHKKGLSEFSISNYEKFTVDQATQWINSEIVRFEQFRLGKFAVKSKALDDFIGISGLFQMPAPRQAMVELNYRYPQAYRGNGYATEAALAILKYGFEVLQLSEINAVIDIRNSPSQRVIERLGMERVGTIDYQDTQAGHWKLKRPAASGS